MRIIAEEVGSAFISLIPSAKGFSKLAERELKREFRGRGTPSVPMRPDFTGQIPDEIPTTHGHVPKLPVQLDPLSRAFAADVRRQTAALAKAVSLQIPASVDTDRLRGEFASQLAAIERSVEVDVPVEPGGFGAFQRDLEAQLAAIEQAVAIQIPAQVDVDVDDAVVGRVVRAGSDIGSGLGESAVSAFGAALKSPVGLAAAASAALLFLPVAGPVIAAAGLAGAGVSAIFLGAFAARNDPLLQQAGSQLMGRLDAALASAAQPLLGRTVGAAVEGFGKAGEVIDAFGRADAKGPLFQAMDILGDAVEAVGPSLRDMFAAIAPHIPVLAQGVAGFLAAFTPGLVDAVIAAGPVLDTIAANLPALGAAFGDFLISLAAAAPGAIAFLDGFLKLLDPIIRGLGFVALGLTVMFEGQLAIIDGLRAFDEAVGRAFRSALDWFDRFAGFAEHAPEQIQQAFSSAGRLLFDAGRNVVQGLIDGIRSRFGALVDSAASIAQTIRNYLPFSPAKVGPLSGAGSPFRSGVAITEGVAEGVLADLPTAAAAASQLAGTFGTGGAGVAGGQRVQLELVGGDEPILAAIREAIRVRNGGDVQGALGSG